tara:strand:+ start:2120 stop:3958 length:1839 start_codon:yes stop_codon:yes gene_type:complete
MKFILPAFGDKIYKDAAFRLKKQIIKSGFSPKDIFIYSEDSPIIEELNTYSKIIFSKSKSYGFCFWAWKPLIIYDFILRNETINKNEIIFYIDSGSEVISNPINIKKLFKRHFISDLDISVGQINNFEIDFTPSYLIGRFFPNFDYHIFHSRQYQASWIGFLLSNRSKNFFESWLKNTIKFLPFFEEWTVLYGNKGIRYDQSILSCLIKKNISTKSFIRPFIPISESFNFLYFFGYRGHNLVINNLRNLSISPKIKHSNISVLLSLYDYLIYLFNNLFSNLSWQIKQLKIYFFISKDYFLKFILYLILHLNRRLNNSFISASYYRFDRPKKIEIGSNIAIIVHGLESHDRAKKIQKILASQYGIFNILIVSSYAFCEGKKEYKKVNKINKRLIFIENKLNNKNFKNNLTTNGNLMIKSISNALKYLKNNNKFDYVIKVRSDLKFDIHNLLKYTENINDAAEDINFKNKIWGIDLHTHKDLEFGFCDVIQFSSLENMINLWSPKNKLYDYLKFSRNPINKESLIKKYLKKDIDNITEPYLFFRYFLCLNIDQLFSNLDEANNFLKKNHFGIIPFSEIKLFLPKYRSGSMNDFIKKYKYGLHAEIVDYFLKNSK